MDKDEEIIRPDGPAVWEAMRFCCPWRVGEKTCDHGQKHQPSKGIYVGPCAFDACPLLGWKKEARR
jgi:hypothetical protein